jgi:hypothetical protein
MVSEENFTSCVSELDLFYACVKWSEKHDQPRQALGDVLRHIRFRTLTYQEFKTHVLPSNLLTDAELKRIALCIKNSTCKLPPGLSNEVRPRYNIAKLKEWVEPIEFQIKGNYKYMTPADISARQIRISTSKAVWMLGVRLFAFREDKDLSVNVNYNQSVEVLLRRRDTIVLAATIYNVKVTCMLDYYVMFEGPYLLTADTEYQIQLNFPITDARHGCFEHIQQTVKTESGVDIRMLKNVWHPGIALILSDYKC